MILWRTAAGHWCISKAAARIRAAVDGSGAFAERRLPADKRAMAAVLEQLEQDRAILPFLAEARAREEARTADFLVQWAALPLASQLELAAEALATARRMIPEHPPQALAALRQAQGERRGQQGGPLCTSCGALPPILERTICALCAAEPVELSDEERRAA